MMRKSAWPAVAMVVAVLGTAMLAPSVRADEGAPVSCDAKIASELASPDYEEFAAEVKSANVDGIALIEALMEDPEVEVVVEEEVAESGIFDFNNDLETIRTSCLDLTFNQSDSNEETSLCFTVVSISVTNTSLTPLELTIPVCRPGGCSPDQTLTGLGCASAASYLFLPLGTKMECEPLAVFCELCNGCFVDGLAELLNISPDYIVVMLVLLAIITLIVVFVVIQKCRARRAGGGNPGARRRVGHKSVSQQYYAQFEQSLQQRKSHHGDGGTLCVCALCCILSPPMTAQC